MIKSKIPIFLASKSPRRKYLLELLGIDFSLLNVDLEESINLKQTPLQNVKRLSHEKSLAAAKKINEGIIITADTIVVLEDEIIGKPISKKNATEILKKLSNKRHIVYTGFTLYNTFSKKLITDYERTFVYFNKLTQEMIRDYVNSGSPLDKAGAYGIQDDFGAVFVKKINGCYYNVVGFPISKIYKHLLSIV